VYTFFDGGAGDFFNSSMMYIFSTFKTAIGIDLIAYPFEFCHGKSTADAHAGIISFKQSQYIGSSPILLIFKVLVQDEVTLCS
jgi:hypothetical protein